MGFYELSKEERKLLVEKIQIDLHKDLGNNRRSFVIDYFSDEDTYIRKSAYLSIGRVFFADDKIQQKVIRLLTALLKEDNPKVRQTVVNSAGEIGIKNFEIVEEFFDKGLFDEHHIVRNAVIGSIKKMGEKNPKPVLKWAKKYLHHDDKEVRREICHGIELRGRTHPQDILPMLQELQFDKTARVRNTLVHVIGQISYKKGCLKTVIEHLNSWDNNEVTDKAVEEIIDVHDRYKNFSVLTQKEAKAYIQKNYKK